MIASRPLAPSCHSRRGWTGYSRTTHQRTDPRRFTNVLERTAKLPPFPAELSCDRRPSAWGFIRAHHSADPLSSSLTRMPATCAFAAWFKTGVVRATAPVDVARQANAAFRPGRPWPRVPSGPRERLELTRATHGPRNAIRRRFLPHGSGATWDHGARPGLLRRFGTRLNLLQRRRLPC